MQFSEFWQEGENAFSVEVLLLYSFILDVAKFSEFFLERVRFYSDVTLKKKQIFLE